MSAPVTSNVELVNKVNLTTGGSYFARFLLDTDGFITAGSDKTLKVWIKRDTGQYWPSVNKILDSEITAMAYCAEQRLLYLGLINGKVQEFKLADDYNSATATNQLSAHPHEVTAVFYSHANRWLLTCSTDQSFAWLSTESSAVLGRHQMKVNCVCLQFDEQSKCAFIGLLSGNIVMLKLSDSGYTELTTLAGHSGSVRSMAWDRDRAWLISGSFDKSIFVWDIGGQQGSVYELNGHCEQVQSVLYLSENKVLISAGQDEMIVYWDLSINREPAATWQKSDLCQSCGAPFFWNFADMWTRRIVGGRQHHCRRCGRAVCADCSFKKRPIPKYGFEYSVRVCTDCYENADPEETQSHVKFHNAHHGVRCLDYDARRRLLLSIGTDRLVKIWDVSSVL